MTASGEVRFTVSNFAEPPLKVTQIELIVLDRCTSDATQVKTPGAPIDEAVLVADVTTADISSTLPRHHLLSPGETDGFLLLVTGNEGQVIDLRLRVHWHVVGTSNEQITASQVFTIDFPSHTPAKLLEVLRRRRGEGR